MTFEEFESDRWADDGGPVTDWRFAVAEQEAGFDLFDPATLGKLKDLLSIELSGMQKLWREVMKRCGVNLDIRAVPAPPWEMAMYNMGAALVTDRVTGKEIDKYLGYGAGISTLYSENEIAAMMAHELGHFVNGDIYSGKNTTEQETAADLYAKQHGYGPDLAKALAITEQLAGPSTCTTKGCPCQADTHPPAFDRIALLTAKAVAA